MPPTSAGDPLHAQIEACLEWLEEHGPESLEAFLAQRPEHAAAVRARVAFLRGAGLLPAEPSAPESPRRLGDYDLLECLGHGGMGVVYRARQRSLGREVAVKIVRPEHLYFGDARTRFRREVEALSRLQHPGIVPILAGGEVDDVPYLVMELVPGASLATIVARLRDRDVATLRGTDLDDAIGAIGARGGSSASGGGRFRGSWVQTGFRIALALAEALAHAHERGVLHRDIKPSNVMLTPDGRVLLLDFGLARATGDASLTRSGGVVGSLPYMAPEQLDPARGPVDARTDVYGLGALLYELLSLEPPFGRGEVVEATRQRILRGTPPRLRSRGSQVSWDAETVCSKALDVDPTRRYATIADFAADLRRFLEHMPITARRPNALLRARRWSQRHPTAATAIVLGVLAVVAGVGAFWWRDLSARHEIGAALVEARRQRDRAEVTLDWTLESVERMLAPLALESPDGRPELDEARRDLLEEALGLYGRLGAYEGDDARLRRVRAHALLRAGETAGLLRDASASGHFETAIAALEPLVNEHPDDRSIALDLARAQRGLAETLDATRGRDAARTWRERALATLTAIAEPDFDAREELALLRLRMSSDPNTDGHYVAAADSIEAATQAFEELARERPDEPRIALRLAQAWMARLSIAINAQLDDADLVAERAHDAVRRARAAGADAYVVASIEAAVALRVAGLHLQHKQLDRARPWLDRALEARDEAVRRAPFRPGARGQRADARLFRGRVAALAGDAPTAIAEYDAAIVDLRAIHEQNPEVVGYRFTLGRTLAARGELRANQGDAAGARRDLDDAIAMLETVTGPRETPLVQCEVGRWSLARARLRLAAGDTAGAAEVLRDGAAAALAARAALPERNDFDGIARETLRGGIALARDAGLDELADELEARATSAGIGNAPRR